MIMEKGKLKELYFDYDHSPLQNVPKPPNKIFVTSDDYQIISKSQSGSFLGIKEVHELNDKTKKTFHIHFESLVNQSKQLFEFLFNQSAEIHDYFKTKDDNWAAFLFSKNKYGVEDFVKDHQARTYELAKLQDKTLNLKIFSHLDLLLGASYGYTTSDTINLFLLLKTNNSKPENLSFLTLTRFSITRNREFALLSENINENRYIEYFENFIKDDFLDDLGEFIKYYQYFSDITLERENFVPIVLDLYNSNRNSESIKKDKRLKTKINSIIDNSKAFIKHKENLTLASFIDYIIEKNEFKLEEIGYDRSKIEELFVRKNAYNKALRVLPHLDKKYVNAQVQSFLDIQSALYL